MQTNNILYAAGILFYGKTVDKTPFFLLGKDYDNRWSDFGGRCESGDKGDNEITAIREAWEESLGCVYDYESLRRCVKGTNCNYVLSKTPSGHPYYMYLVKIPFSQIYRDRFLSTKKFISKTNIDKKFLEINDVKWVSFETIETTMTNKEPMVKLRSVFEQNFLNNINEIKKIIRQ